MRKQATIITAKIAGKATRLLGRGGGTALPGLLSERLDPKLAAKLSATLVRGCIIVTGTNGKTTTTKLLTSIFEASGESVVSNRAGSNLKRGILASLIASSNINGKMKGSVGIFEVDEASLRTVAPLLKPKLIVVTNLFRDQLDRYGELDSTAALIGEGIAGSQAQICLNADDPLVASLAKYAEGPEKVTYFGIDGIPSAMTGNSSTAVDSDRCPKCGGRLEFSRVFYAHIGHYRCINNDNDRPHPQNVITHVEQSSHEGQQFEVSLGGKRYSVEIGLPGTYNLYNALAALSAASLCDVKAEVSIKAIGKTDAAFGRVEKIEVAGRNLTLILIKNPTGFNQVVSTFLDGQTTTVPVGFIINDNYADGRDVSWLWDVNLDNLGNGAIKAEVSGTRATDMALRLKYAGIPSRLAQSPRDLVSNLVGDMKVGESAYVLVTYTAMLDLRADLSKEFDLAEVWS